MKKYKYLDKTLTSIEHSIFMFKKTTIGGRELVASVQNTQMKFR